MTESRSSTTSDGSKPSDVKNSEAIVLQKKLFRKTALQYRQLLDPEEYGLRNQTLMNSVLAFLLEKKIVSVHIFLPIKKNNEPNIQLILPQLWERGIEVITSKTDFTQKQMSHFQLTPETRIEINSKGIPEPMDGIEVSVESIDAILIPLMIADKEGNRIGYGGGYYDQLLKETKAIKIGLSLSNPIDKIVQSDEWDVPLNYLITPFNTFDYG